MSQAGPIDILGTFPQIPTDFITDSGTAIPVLNQLEILTSIALAGTSPIITTGLGNTVTITAQISQALAAADVTKIGLANFDSSMFSVDADGFVTLAGGTTGVDSVAVQTGTSPILPDGTGLITINGAVVAAGVNPVRSDGTGVNTLAIEVQTSQALAATDATKIGLCNFDSEEFQVDANGFTNFSTNAATTAIHGWNGSILESAAVTVTSDGATITCSVQKSGGGNLTVVFSTGYYAWTTAPDTVTLAEGSDTAPLLYYVYLLESTKVLTASTVGWPVTEHAPICTTIVQTAASLATDGPYKMHAWTDHVVAADDQGHIGDINFWIRQQPATWVSGVVQSYNIVTNGGAADNVNIDTTAGIVLQLHPHVFPAFTTVHDYYVINDSGTPYLVVTDLNALLTDSTGASMSGKYFSLIMWGVVNEATGDCKLFINLPSGSYNNAASVTSDVSDFANFNIPAAYTGTGFLISQWNLRHLAAASGTWTSIDEIDLRGLLPSITPGGTTAQQTEFPDNLFRIFDDGDDTKKIAFEVSPVTTATTRTITAADYNIDLATVCISSPTDSGTATPALGALTIIGQDGITTSGATSIVTITPRGAGTGNMFLGEGAGNLTLSGTSNVGFGSLSSPALTTGSNNVSVGISAGTKINSGDANISIGKLSNGVLTTGSDNIAIGFGALDANVSSAANIAIGSNALTACTSAGNVAIGVAAAGTLTSGERTVAVGNNALIVATGTGNTAIGYQSLVSLTTGIENTGVGDTTGTFLLTGDYNIAIGKNAGTGWTGAETSNIAIGHDGFVGDSNIIRLGEQGTGASEVNSCFIAGIVGVTVSNAVSVVIDSTTGEMGVGPIQQVFPVTLLDNTDSPYTALAAEYMYSCNVSAGILTINLPNAPTTGRAFVVKDTGGNANTNNITITTVGGVVTIDGSTTFAMNTNYQSTTLIFNGTSYAVI